MAGLPRDVTALVEAVDTALGRAMDDVADRLAGMHPDLDPLARELVAFVLRGGKRLRPLFVLLGHRAAGASSDEAAMPCALAVELLHTCALVHDDLIDAADTRRGAPAAHVALARTDATTDVDAGDAARFGRAAALLLGDLAHVLSDDLFLASTAPPARLLAAFRVFTLMREEVTAGQFLDVRAAFRREASPEQALAVASYKSGRYSVARPLQLGATLAGDRGVAERLVRVGLPLGQAFQIRDDVLGVFGTADETGKPTNSDLVEGKRTLLVANTLERLDGATRARVDGLLGHPGLSADEADEIRRCMRESGGLEATEKQADALVDEAMAELTHLPVEASVRETLRRLATYLVARRA